MKSRKVTVPELGLIAGTRALMGFGVGLLLADKFNSDERRALGWTLLAVGLISTIPLAAEVLLSPDSDGQKNGHGSDGESTPEDEMASWRA
jgi:hypothetical protein